MFAIAFAIAAGWLPQPCSAAADLHTPIRRCLHHGQTKAKNKVPAFPVVVDESEEMHQALQFACRRAESAGTWL